MSLAEFITDTSVIVPDVRTATLIPNLLEQIAFGISLRANPELNKEPPESSPFRPLKKRGTSLRSEKYPRQISIEKQFQKQIFYELYGKNIVTPQSRNKNRVPTYYFR